MSYIGNTYQQQATVPATDYFNGNGVNTSFTLSRTVLSPFAIEVVVNNVQQNPASAFGISGNVITFSSAPSVGTNNIYINYNPVVAQLGYPGQGTVSPTSFTYPNILSWDGNGLITTYSSATVAGNLTVNGRVIINTPFIENTRTINANFTLTTTTNYMSAGPITIANGVTVTMPDGAYWTIV